jgi:hypothetical protein
VPGGFGTSPILSAKLDARVESKTSGLPDIWLVSWLRQSFKENARSIYLRLCSEEVYHLSLGCDLLRAPDIYTPYPVMLEGEYSRDLIKRFGPPTLDKFGQYCRTLLLQPHMRARFKRQDISIFIASAQANFNALLDQLVGELNTKRPHWNHPEQQMQASFIATTLTDPPVTGCRGQRSKSTTGV